MTPSCASRRAQARTTATASRPCCVSYLRWKSAMKVSIGTRGSPLALIQAKLVADALSCESDLVIVRTEGDRNRQDPLAVIGGRGVFVRDIEERLLAGEFD